MTEPQSLIFGKYELIRRLALGGMGEVFLARQTGGVAGADRLVILKSLLSELAEQDGFIDQFLDEARVASKLNHPNVVQMLEAGLWNGVYFIAMEYIRGENLSRIQKTAKAKKVEFPIHLIVKVIRDALNGLGHAHSAVDDQTGKPLGVVHRDVSPQNIMVRVDGVTKVVDFGIAKAGNRSSRTATGVLKGKLQFMAPEQVKGEEVDKRTDLFAMGVVLWELLTGQRLFSGDNEIAVLKAVLQQPIPTVGSIVPGFPPELDAIVMKMLEREPAQRQQSCEEAADDLSGWLSQGSRRVSEADVANFIRPLVGENVDEMTRNLAPSGENFMIQLHHTPSKGTAAETSPTKVQRLQQEQSRARKVGVGVGVGAAVVVVAVLSAFFIVVAAPEPPPPIVAAIPVVPPPPRVEAPVVVPPSVVPPTVEIKTTPPGASIIIGGSSFGMTPAKITRLSAGATHELLLQKDGFQPAKVVVENLMEGDVRTFDVPLVKLEKRVVAAKPPKEAPTVASPPENKAPGILAVNTKPGSSKVFLDGDLVGTTPLFMPKVPPGKHTLVLENLTNGKKRTKAIDVVAGQKTKVDEIWE